MISEKKPITARDIANLKRELKDIKQNCESLRSMVGFDQLKGWTPDKRIEVQYGWLYAWLYPLRSCLNSNQHDGISPDKRNEIISIANVITSQLVINGKYGVRVPHKPKAVDVENYFDKQRKYFNLVYDPCDVCGENRITHHCHIVPRSEGGPNHIDNFVTLCPLHHHLFDNHRLNKAEWEILMNTIDKKMSSAVVYSKAVHEKQMEYFWQHGSETNPREYIK